MTLADLHHQLAPDFPDYARKNLKTAVHVLARALDCSDPEHCTLAHYNRPLPAIYTLVEHYLIVHGKKPHTVRNIKNYLSRLFRLSESKQLFSLVPIKLHPRYLAYKKPPRLGTIGRTNGTYLSYHQWPSDLQDAFRNFVTWATAPLVPGRDASLKKRLPTIRGYRVSFEAYFGFLYHIQQVVPVTFEHLFDLSLITSFVHWHVNELHHRSTHAMAKFLTCLLAITRQYRPLPALRADLVILKKTLPKPAPAYNKNDAWVSLATLDQVARACWPKKKPTDMDMRRQRPGLYEAARAGVSLMLRLWTYIPYRSRNMREMELGTNLSQDAHGKWRLTFRGEQLKIATKGGRVNVFDMPFPDSLVPVLEDYLSLWRPILLAKAPQQCKLVFITRHGNPFTATALNRTTQDIVYRYTGNQCWHPHIIRTVWATEWIQKTHGDFYTAAIMLNDRLETVIAKYTHLLEEDVAEKAYRLIDERNGQGT